MKVLKHIALFIKNFFLCDSPIKAGSSLMLVFLFYVSVKAQPNQTNNPLLLIDSLKKVLPALKDSNRVDCLNKLSDQYILAEKKDSAIYFTTIAHDEAEKINYNHGIAVSLLHKSQIAKHFDDDFIKSESFGRESLHWYEMTANKKGIDILYGSLWWDPLESTCRHASLSIL